MPPWYVDSRGPAIKGGSALTPSESDKLLTWVTGGTPEGDPDKKPASTTYQPRWSGGAPDLKLAMDSEYTMPAGETEATSTRLVSGTPTRLKMMA